MKCFFCNHPETQVLDSRDTENLEAIRRRRECLKCQKRFTTYERMESMNITVIKKDNSREEYEREKIKKGITKAAEKRNIPYEKIEEIIDDIENEIREYKTTEIPSSKIGRMAMKRLKKLDKVSYVRFASVYREFADLDDFEEEVHKLLRRKKANNKVKLLKGLAS